MDSMIEENVEKLNKEHGEKAAELEKVKKTTEAKMWMSDIEKLEVEYTKYIERRYSNPQKKGTKKRKSKKLKLVSK